MKFGPAHTDQKLPKTPEQVGEQQAIAVGADGLLRPFLF